MTYAHELTYELDEEYPFLIEAHGKVTGWLSIPVYGKALIYYNDPDDYIVSSFTTDADNYGLHPNTYTDTWTVTLDGGPIFEAVKNYILKMRREDIETKIHEELYENDDEYRRDYNISNAA